MVYVFIHRKTPWYVRILIVALLIYTASPIDLIPDFIPILGWLDDLIIIWLGLKLATRLTPSDIMIECRQRAEENQEDWSLGKLFKLRRQVKDNNQAS